MGDVAEVRIARRTGFCYGVREAIGMIKGPVFPQGNEVSAGDLSLLDPVIANSEQHKYRQV